MIKIERPHQADARVAINNSLYILCQPRCNISMPCGTGKTLVFLWLIEKVVPKIENVSVVFAPNIHLCYQNYKEFVENQSEEFEPMLICTGSDVKEEKNFLKGIKDKVKVSTEQGVVDTFMNNGSGKRKVLFCTYHSAEKVLKYKFDICISDEAHRTAGSKKKKFATVHSIIATKKLFATATPKVRSPSQIQKHQKGDTQFYYCMSDKMFYGDCVYEMSLMQAIKLDLVNDYQIIIMGVDRTMITQEALQYVHHTDEMILINYAVEKVMNEMGIKKLAVFHNLIKHSENFLKYHNVLVSPRTKDTVIHIDGTVKLDERIKAFDEFRKADRAILTNVRAIGEGHNESCLEAVMFVADKNSAIDIVQSACRPLRKHPGKTKSYIIIPIFYDQRKDSSGANIEMTKEDIDAMVEDEKSNFSNAVTILRQLSSSDKRIETYMNLASTPQKKDYVGQRTMEDVKNEMASIVSDVISFKDFPFKLIGMEEHIKEAIYMKMVNKFSEENWIDQFFEDALKIIPEKDRADFLVKGRAKWIEINGGKSQNEKL